MKKVFEAAWFSVVIVLALSLLVENAGLFNHLESWVRNSVQ